MNASNLISIMKMEYKPSEKCTRMLQNMLADKPWFTIGHQLLAKEIQRLGQDDFENYLIKVAIYSPNRKLLYDRLFDASQNQNNSIELQNFNLEDEQLLNEIHETEKQPVFDYPVIDYFSNHTVDINEKSEDIVDKFLSSSHKISIEAENNKNENIEIGENTSMEAIIGNDFVTETLAKIYAEQGYFSKAIEIYEKLSLQDSKKSIYFASLIENLKKGIKN
jgi:tetratricopeptide (TPR) repeat protein